MFYYVWVVKNVSAIRKKCLAFISNNIGTYENLENGHYDSSNFIGCKVNDVNEK